ncbi:recombination-associated protein RdgC [Aestuariibacter halophilus]|uniref:Recombination-associated protein RdgC n=1 Tax=Fluctibacter halophilus TaxID=226011 RepID=A0ABS8G7M2_9ALTE|nr:recombination-associated protein RdgC [Aestuariibacter halophilus]MCC2616428.1 recombination-associated protein RdgC [Aestuariibacter halophilus]
MWFKNLKLYTLTQPLSLNEDDLQSMLAEQPFRPCGSQDTATMGWSAPLGQGDQLLHVADGRIWLTLKKQERLLPSTVVNAELADKVAAIEAETGAPVGKKAQQDLKQEIIHRLLPQAFTKNTFTHGFLSLKDNLVVVDASADGKAEAFLATLRKAIGSLPVVPMARRSIAPDLTLWLKGQGVPDNTELLEEAELRASGDDDSIVRCKNQDLGAPEILQHLEAGKLVHKLAIGWDETLTAMIEDDLGIKRLKFTDVIREQNDDIPKDQLAAKQDADFALMSGEIVRFALWLQQTFDLGADA